VLSNQVLASIWAGNITAWDHPDIAALNPNITLPSAAITLVFSPPPWNVEMTGVLLRALSHVSSQFAAALASAGGSIDRLVPANSVAANGTAARLAMTEVCVFVLLVEIAAKITYPVWSHGVHQATAYSMTFADYASVVEAGMSCAKMKNAAGMVVSPTSAAIQSAMMDFSNYTTAPRKLTITHTSLFAFYRRH
jgi:hypothetical protein